MKTRKLLFHLVSLLVFASLLAACGGAATEPPAATEMPATDMPATEMPATEAPGATEAPVEGAANMDELIAAAQAEGTVTTIALPHNWCNYGAVIEGFKEKYGLEVNELDPNAGSGDELEAIRANRESQGPQAPDVIDVGLSFGPAAKEEGLIQPYMVSTWDTIPDDAKDPEGYWYGDYYGVLALQVNTDVVENVPQDWADLLDPQYNGQVALAGDPRTSNQAILSVYAASLANGGSLDDAQPGLDFWAQVNQAGNFVPVIADTGTFARGETPIIVQWDYLALGDADELAGNPPVEVVIPESGRLGGIYVQAISAYAPHPNAAKLWMEWLYSDEGQLLWMEGYCHPIREPDLRARGVIPQDLLDKIPDVSGAVFPALEQQDAARTVITEGWDAVVGVDVQSSP